MKGLRLGLGMGRRMSIGSVTPLPTNTVAPIVTGTGYVGYTLTTTNGTWTNADTFAYQWQRSGVDIGGATASTYNVTIADEGLPVRCVVTATGPGGSTPANSNAIEQWVPSDIPSTWDVWLDAFDASTITLSGSTVSEWADRSGNGNHVSQGLSANQPLYEVDGFNGRPNLRNVSNDFLSRSDPEIVKNAAGGTIVLAGLVANASYNSNASPVFISTGTSGSSTRLAASWNPNGSPNIGLACRRLDANTFTPIPSSTSRASVQDAPIVQVVQMSWASALANNWTNGTQDLTDETALTPGNTSNTAPRILGIFGGGTGIVMTASGTEIAEVLIASRVLTTSERQSAEGYIAHRWGFAASLPGGHPYAAAAPTP